MFPVFPEEIERIIWIFYFKNCINQLNNKISKYSLFSKSNICGRALIISDLLVMNESNNDEVDYDFRCYYEFYSFSYYDMEPANDCDDYYYDYNNNDYNHNDYLFEFN